VIGVPRHRHVGGGGLSRGDGIDRLHERIDVSLLRLAALGLLLALVVVVVISLASTGALLVASVNAIQRARSERIFMMPLQ
jgi:hypothetical protein